MATVKGVKIAKRLIVLTVLVIIIFFAYKFITAAPAVKPIASNIVQLKSQTNPLDKAKIVSSTDNLVRDLSNQEVQEQWDLITKCINTGCTDKRYFDFLIILTTQYQDEIANSELLLNILAVQRYWGTDDVIMFSKAMSHVDEQIEQTQSRTLKKKWEEIISCNNECPESSDLFLGLIHALVN